LKIKEKDDLKKQKRHKYLPQHDVAEEKPGVTEQQLRFLPPLARDSNDTPSRDDELTQQLAPKKKFSKLSKAKFEYKKIIHQ
ncbi:hypothetical protein GUF49_10005, partial [Xanthomonas citri pv. citri]|nr:hypothetical protein [Xanthomonas citri pv. citri]